MRLGITRIMQTSPAPTQLNRPDRPSHLPGVAAILVLSAFAGLVVAVPACLLFADWDSGSDPAGSFGVDEIAFIGCVVCGLVTATLAVASCLALAVLNRLKLLTPDSALAQGLMAWFVAFAGLVILTAVVLLMTAG